MSHDEPQSEAPPDGDEFQLAPLAGRSREDFDEPLEPRQRVKLPLADIDKQRIEQNRRRPRFSLRELIAMTTIVAIGLGGAKWLPEGLFAGLAGLLAVGGVIFLVSYKDASRASQFVGWALVVVYVAAAVVSVAHRWQ